MQVKMKKAAKIAAFCYTSNKAFNLYQNTYL